ncbi:zinc/manganese transport system substrate-binding protein [Amycolatopsis bartoniae]|uniref:Metal ABC transporter substrate-binding protein n=1 Tax=Amycolatopsis bartoniae TaxID=941986 RepID=A0A8H9J1I7_9PSEU|nr:zinc ABC transporter substrate-binding protein [Amycolatopsis bartoniae]MBB2935112.1 zinc/manganese transport system substrate-binding protein [Amycolatopsis bartoniae]TVT06992.1 metal ABC transporter substrate-binding protein [Amycolatopsis bartoniae]GHF74440.1 metal ABC transporter substrate-binding protein [Amycolatopsis bartoniae]
MRSSRSPRLIGLASAATALVLGLTGCGGGNTAGDSSGKIAAVASTDVWGSVLTAVGGDEVQVTSIIHDPAADPHSYETTPQDALAAQRAQLTLANGGGYDDFFTKLADQAPNAKKLVAYDIGATGDENEHVWYSFATVQKVADQVAAELGQLRPADAQTFTANAAAFKAKVTELQTKAEQAGAAHPGSKVLATEPVAHYLLETAKVTDATPHEFSEAVENESDVPAAAVAEVNAIIAGKQVKAVVDNAQTVTPTTQQVVDAAKGAGLPVVDVTETLPAGATDYISWMTSEVDALAGALNS